MPKFISLSKDDLTCAISTRSAFNMSLTYGKKQGVIENRRRFLEEIGIDYRDLVCAQQVHGSNVSCVKEQDKGKGALALESAIPYTDALISDKRNVPLAVFTADCLPIFLYEPKRGMIGLVHAGWRSSKERIASKAVGLMRQKFGIDKESIRAFLGPAIRSCCYEVGREFFDFFPGQVIKKDGRFYLDLVRANIEELEGAGVPQDNILDTGVCTCCGNDNFFSFRKEGPSCGRMMAVIMLK
ncbi:MAG: peptidoglycan editing factor PgeF [Candidatus Omnitrophica bacterium]|nr:peptidoglycan editing factor PgeF [Candidatus Omnitrophota bacterium]